MKNGVEFGSGLHEIEARIGAKELLLEGGHRAEPVAWDQTRCAFDKVRCRLVQRLQNAAGANNAFVG
jgi:hypothetical protein